VREALVDEHQREVPEGPEDAHHGGGDDGGMDGLQAG
jgi:hypothetical protein